MAPQLPLVTDMGPGSETDTQTPQPGRWGTEGTTGQQRRGLRCHRQALKEQNARGHLSRWRQETTLGLFLLLQLFFTNGLTRLVGAESLEALV